jgi:hypothetical protein
VIWPNFVPFTSGTKPRRPGTMAPAAAALEVLKFALSFGLGFLARDLAAKKSKVQRRQGGLAGRPCGGALQLTGGACSPSQRPGAELGGYTRKTPVENMPPASGPWHGPHVGPGAPAHAHAHLARVRAALRLRLRPPRQRAPANRPSSCLCGLKRSSKWCGRRPAGCPSPPPHPTPNSMAWLAGLARINHIHESLSTVSAPCCRHWRLRPPSH